MLQLEETLIATLLLLLLLLLAVALHNLALQVLWVSLPACLSTPSRCWMAAAKVGGCCCCRCRLRLLLFDGAAQQCCCCLVLLQFLGAFVSARAQCCSHAIHNCDITHS
jgi:hypothetical protein